MARRRDEDEDDRPRRRRNEDDDDRPQRRDRDDDEYDRRGRDRDDDDRPRRSDRDDDDRPRRRRSSKDMGFLDRTFADTNIVLLILFAVCLFPLAFCLSVLELIVGQNNGAVNKANVCLCASIVAAIMLAIAFLNSGAFN